MTSNPAQAVLLEAEFQLMALLAGLGTNAVFEAGDPTIGLGALPILKIKEILETGEIDGQMRGLLAATLAGLIALGTQGIANNSRKQREQNKEEKIEDR